MQRFFSRLAWHNVPLRIKTTAIFVLQTVLVSVMAVAGFVALGNVSSASSTAISTIVQMRSVAQDMQIKVDEMDLTETSLTNNYLQPGFDPTKTVLPDQFATLAANVRTDSEQILALSANLGGPIAPSAFALQVADVQANQSKSQDRFSKVVDPIRLLTRPNNGALAVLKTESKALQDQTFSRGNPDLIAQMDVIRDRENTLLVSNPTEETRAALHSAVSDYLARYRAVIPPDQQGSEIGQATAYDQQVDTVYDLLNQIAIGHSGAQAQIINLRSSISRVATLTESQTAAPVETLAGVISQARLILVLGLLVAVIAGAFVTNLFSQDLISSVHSLLATARLLQAGDLKARAAVRGKDEFNELGNNFNALAVQMDGLIRGLEQRVAERARDLSITADIGRAVVALPDSRELMNEIVELIRQRFGFYHAQVFLVDEHGVNAILVASTGTAGRELINRKHSIAIGSQSVIGQVTSQGMPLIASDTDVSPVHKRNELLPDTRSEMALPMRIGDRVIGALDVQSVAPNAFEADSVAVFQIMADQLAIALENTRLLGRLQNAERSLEAFQQRVTREAWETYQESRDPDSPIAFRFSEDKVEPHRAAAPAPLAEAILSGQLTTADNAENEIGLAIPIRVRGEVIGAFGFGGDALQNLSAEDIALAEAVVNRVGLALENIRLVEQTARRAEREQIVNEITAKIVGSTDIDFILQTTVKELGRVLRAPQTSVQLRREGTETHHE